MTALITRIQLESLRTAGEAVLVDALPASYYDQQQLPGALKLVESEVDARAAQLLPDKGATIVTYCSNAACGNSQAVANRLQRLGLHRRPEVPRGHPGLGRGRKRHRVRRLIRTPHIHHLINKEKTP